MIGLIGGSGIYDPQMLKNAKKVKVETPFGKPSDEITTGEFEGVKIAFIPRHGAKHQFNPSNVPYHANIWALKKLGVTRILSPCAVGSLQEEIKPGELVLVDQFIDKTYARETTFYDKEKVCHISVAEPMCPELRQLLVKDAKKLGLSFHEKGTYVCMEGPRFSTKAESLLHRSWGASVIGMTLCPEAVLAREAEICYASIATVTDYDTFKEGEHVSIETVIKTMNENLEKVKALLQETIPKIPVQGEKCGCGS
ncbi:MAG: S-methyl-5'-thioadenosine phosphorylase, partial [Candidatus Diapherotrites archaeon]